MFASRTIVRFARASVARDPALCQGELSTSAGRGLRARLNRSGRPFTRDPAPPRPMASSKQRTIRGLIRSPRLLLKQSTSNPLLDALDIVVDRSWLKIDFLPQPVQHRHPSIHDLVVLALMS